MTERAPSPSELLETDALLDSLGARHPAAAPVGNTALAALATLATAVDERPLPAPPRRLSLTAAAARHTHRSRGVGFVLAGVLTVTSGGIAAAVTGDPLTPIKAVVHHWYGVDDPAGPDSNWILGSRRHHDADRGSAAGVRPGPQAHRLVQESREGVPWNDVLVPARDGGVPHPEARDLHVVPASHAHHLRADLPRSRDTRWDPRDTTDTRDSHQTGGNRPTTHGSRHSRRPSPTGSTTPGDHSGDSNDPGNEPGDDPGDDGGNTAVMLPANVPGGQDPCQTTGASSTPSTPSTPSAPSSCSPTQEPQPAPQPPQPTQPPVAPRS